MNDTRTRLQRMADDGPQLLIKDNTVLLYCTRCCKRADWCTCRHRRRQRGADGIWR